MRVETSKCDSCGRPMGERHVATMSRPDYQQIASWIMDVENTQATDGCDVESDGFCEHGHQSWLLRLKMI